MKKFLTMEQMNFASHKTPLVHRTFRNIVTLPF